MKLSLFDYQLPKERIAQKPVRPRDSSRLMVLGRERTAHDFFFNLGRQLESGDILVLNDSKVLKARFDGMKPTGGKVELTLLTPAADQTNGMASLRWTVLLKGKKLKEGSEILFREGWRCFVEEQVKDGEFLVTFACERGRGFVEFMERQGRLPLPPYIKSEPKQPSDYQTVYAENEGSVAAPTAGLHFTPKIFRELEQSDVKIAKLTLHVGLGTFLPVKTQQLEDHPMHSEFYSLDEKNVGAINEALEEGGRLVAVGTTSMRVLEAVAAKHGKLVADSGSTDLFIYPGYEFRSGVELLLTNFHLPCSTLLMLVSAFAGRERVLGAYEEAKRLGYRFYSFGDAMLVEKV